MPYSSARASPRSHRFIRHFFLLLSASWSLLPSAAFTHSGGVLRDRSSLSISRRCDYSRCDESRRLLLRRQISRRAAQAALSDDAVAVSDTHPPAKRALTDVDDHTFSSAVLSGSKTVLVFFSASWCGPCKLAESVLEDLSDELAGQVDVYRVCIDSSPGVAIEYRIRSIPTCVLFRDGKAVDRVVGAVPRATIMKTLNAYVN
ncbi:unnamed protein product [Vitrella brassicaformis CCMP3155]|uniref:Thioredoxin domain-containing protein n=1 Tax=Vitrella brassicaformis (strain CCMP3155) TaxID=1169540 RepID=A0A0G4GRF2_VITBC|nr:unnamed protein product [Vitrella brassicaformis CCMP3155]|eukprot:CEM33101.1 unnamed protein product [Vitrella brassicaformis CCMP3155]